MLGCGFTTVGIAKCEWKQYSYEFYCLHKTSCILLELVISVKIKQMGIPNDGQ